MERCFDCKRKMKIVCPLSKQNLKKRTKEQKQEQIHVVFILDKDFEGKNPFYRY